MTADSNETAGLGGGQQPGGAPGEQTPGWLPPAYTPPYPPPRRPINGLALASLIVSLVSLLSCPLVGGVAVYLGNRARTEIRQSGEEGAGFAQAGIIIGWCAVGLAALMVLFFLAYLNLVIFVASDV